VHVIITRDPKSCESKSRGDSITPGTKSRESKSRGDSITPGTKSRGPQNLATKIFAERKSRQEKIAPIQNHTIPEISQDENRARIPQYVEGKAV
jgi:hypothetical protein